MSALDISREAILAMFSSPEEYKKLSKLYKQSVHEGDVRTMLALTEMIAQSLNKQKDEKPFVLLHALRFVKETLSKDNSGISAYSELVAERVLPALARCAMFDSAKKDEDRGKFYFSEKPTNEQAIVGNSFFRLALECLIIWA